MDYARQVADGKIVDSRLFFFHRQAADDVQLYDESGNIDLQAVRAAVIEASGPVAEWSDIDGIVEQWRDPTADLPYLERVWLNRLVRDSERAFDTERWKALADPDFQVPDGDMITIGFDGARYHDSTALVATHITSGYQWVLESREHTHGIESREIQVVEVEEAAAVCALMSGGCTATRRTGRAVASWAGQYGRKAGDVLVDTEKTGWPTPSARIRQRDRKWRDLAAATRCSPAHRPGLPTHAEDAR